MNKYERAIKKIIQFKKAIEAIGLPNGVQKILGKLKGEIGELYVLDKLEKRGFKELELKG